MKISADKKMLLCLPEWTGRNHSFFLGICDLASFLKKNGIAVEIFDEDVSAFAAAQEDKEKDDILQSALTDFKPDFVGIHMNTPNYENALQLARKVRYFVPNAKIVAGGPHATAAWQVILQGHPEIDYISVGEGELSILSLVKTSGIENGNLPPGIAGRFHHEIKYTPRSFMPCNNLVASDRSAILESPFPEIKKWAKKRYADNFYNSIYSFEGRTATNAYIARGCVRKCPYCSPGAFWKDPLTGAPNQRIKPFSVLETELKYLKEQGFGALYFDEMALPLQSAKWLGDFSHLMKEYDFFWGGAVLFDQIKQISVEKLFDSGLRYVYFGFETPQTSLQKAIKKESSTSDVTTFMRNCDANGIQCDLSMFFGIPGETDQTVEQTIFWLLENLPKGNAFFSVAAIWPGTPWAEEYGLSSACWEPQYEKKNSPQCVNWFSHDMTSIGKFYSNALGTYHPPYLTPEKALWIKQKIMDSGFRDRFATYARRRVNK